MTKRPPAVKITLLKNRNSLAYLETTLGAVFFGGSGVGGYRRVRKTRGGRVGPEKQIQSLSVWKLSTTGRFRAGDGG